MIMYACVYICHILLDALQENGKLNSLNNHYFHMQDSSISRDTSGKISKLKEEHLTMYLCMSQGYKLNPMLDLAS